MEKLEDRIEARTSKNCKRDFIKKLKEHEKTQSYIFNLVMDAFIADPIDTVVRLEKIKASKLWQ